MMEEFLKDDIPNVKLKFCENIQHVVDVFNTHRNGRDLFDTQLKDLLLDIGKENKYRGRLAIVKNLHHICGFLGTEEWQGSEFEDLLTNAFTDPAAAVRRAAVDAMNGIVRLSRSHWAYIQKSKVMEQIKKPFEQDSSCNYHHRLVALFFCRDLYRDMHDGTWDSQGQPVSDQEIKTSFRDVILKSLQDDVPNVKVEANKVTEALASMLQGDKEIQDAVDSCEADDDADVRYFAELASAAMKDDIGDW